MKVAWVKGSGLPEWESEIYEQIAEKGINMIGLCSEDNLYNLTNVRLPLKKLKRIGQFNKIPLFSQGSQYFYPVNNMFINFDSATEEFDILHSSENFNPFSYQCVKSNKPTVITVWENIPFIHERQYYKHFKSEVNRNADHFIAVSEYSKSMLLVEGVPEEKISVILPGIDLKRFKPLPKDKSLLKKYGLTGKKVILSVGSLVHGNKDFKNLLYAFKLLNDKDSVLIIAGKGNLRNSPIELAARLDISSSVRFIDGFPYNRIEHLYSLCDVFVLPSFPLFDWQEQFGYVLAEAMACGKPVISTYCGAIPEVVKEGETCLLVSPGNFLELKHALERLLSNSKLRTDMGKKGRSLCEERYDSRKVADEYIKVYKKVLSDRKNGKN